MSKGGIFDDTKAIYHHGSYGEELYDLPKEAKALSNSKSIGELTVGVTLQGYEDLKESLNDIEAQLDRITEKQNKINKCNSMSPKKSAYETMTAYANPTSHYPTTPYPSTPYK